jgi:hypothetical protein
MADKSNWFDRCWKWRRGKGNTFQDERGEDFAVALVAAIELAQHWNVVDLAGRAHVVNWRFEHNQADEDQPGLVWVDAGETPAISVDGCSFSKCDLRVIDAILDLVREAQD